MEISVLLERCSWKSETGTKVSKRKWRKTRRNGNRRGHVGLPIPTLQSESDVSEYEDEDSEQETPIQTPGYPQELVQRRIKNAIDGYQASQLEVMDTLEQILNRLRNLTGASELPCGNTERAAG